MAAPYSNKVMDHFMHPRNVGEMENPDGIGHVGNPVCVVPGTLICKNPDVVTIQNLKAEDKVLSHDGKHHEVTRVYERPYEGQICKIMIQDRGEAKITPDHHVLAMKNKVVDWYAVSELEKGDEVLYPVGNRTRNQPFAKVSWLGHDYYCFAVEGLTSENYSGNVYNLDVSETHSYVSPALVLHNCGDIMEMYIKVKDGVITDAKFKTFGCLPATEEIVSAEGGWQKIASVLSNDQVVNEAGEETHVAQTQTQQFTGTLVKFIPFVSPFNSFSVTSEHPVLAVKRNWLERSRFSSKQCKWKQVRDEKELLNFQPEYVKAGNLEEGDFLIFTVNKQVYDNPAFTKETMRLLGYYLSEGYSSAQGSVMNFAFNKNERENINEVKSLLKKIAGKKATERTRGSVTEVYTCSRKLCRFLYSAAGRYARHKSLSKEVLLLPFEKQWEMILTYLKGDGDYYRRRKENSETYRATTTSRNLAIQIQEILARGGIFASIREIYKENCVIDGRKLKNSIQYLISFKLSRKHKFVHYNNSHFLVPIRKTSRRPFQGKVYNFQVANEPNSYLIKGFAAHNCGAAIATSSMATELIKGKTIEEALKITNQAVAEALGGLPKVKMHCSVLAEEAFQAAINDYLLKTTGKGLPGFKPHEEPLEEH